VGYSRHNVAVCVKPVTCRTKPVYIATYNHVPNSTTLLSASTAGSEKADYRVGQKK